ncbi:MAG: hemolysin family protein [Planctomycetota bacterium]|nr:hemolysin family protein [Planctomycetota bacterium]
MDLLIELLPWLFAMIVLIVCSGFFSASEAALFSLRLRDREQLATGGSSQRMATRLLDDPDRLLSAVLFWNLVVNMIYFAIVSVVGLRLERDPSFGRTYPAVFAAVSLLVIIFFSEMLPKSVGVLINRKLAGLLGAPLTVAVRILDPVMPSLRFVNLLSRRMIWPGFKSEPYLEVSDLERAIFLSTTDAKLVEQEQAVLRNIVLLSDIRADEWMRPRTQFRTFRPPVSLADLNGQMTPSGYMLVTEPSSEEVESAIHLKELFDVPRQRLEHYAEPVIYVPWCATVADALQEMQRRNRQVAAVVNEYGETCGILTFEDILDTVFTYSPSRSKLLLDEKPIHNLGPGMWLVAGVTPLRRLSRYLDLPLPTSKNVTVGGVIQEQLGKLAEEGDACNWGPFRMKVLEAPERGHMLIELKLLHRGEMP